MTDAGVVATVRSVLTQPRVITALTPAIVGTAILAFALRQLIGWPGLIAILATLAVIATLSIVAKWNDIEWRGILPVSLLVFLFWASISIFWSHYKWATLGALAYLFCFTILGLYIALLRDTIQIVRAFGDVLRVILGVSIALEVFSGVLIDAPIRFLGVLGRLDQLGPIQGLTGARNQLGILAVIALITFATEYRTRSVSTRISIGSLILGAGTLLLTNSQLAIGAALAVVLAAAALYGLRRVQPQRARFWQIGLLAATATAAIVVWAFRSVIITAADASSELDYRLDIWRRAWDLIALYPLQGWGWIGTWREDIPPFVLFRFISERNETSASNALLDVWLQLGFVGLAIFIGLVGLAFVRSWLLASRRKSVVFTWPALVLLTLALTALGESSILWEFGWMAFVICSVKAAEQLSWRRAFNDI